MNCVIITHYLHLFNVKDTSSLSLNTIHWFSLPEKCQNKGADGSLYINSKSFLQAISLGLRLIFVVLFNHVVDWLVNHVLKLTNRHDGAIVPQQASAVPVGFPFLNHSNARTKVRRQRKRNILYSQATTITSVYQNGQPCGGGFTGGLSQSSRGSIFTVQAARWSGEAQLLQLQRSDTRWWLWVSFHVGTREIQIRTLKWGWVCRTMDKGILYTQWINNVLPGI